MRGFGVRGGSWRALAAAMLMAVVAPMLASVPASSAGAQAGSRLAAPTNLTAGLHVLQNRTEVYWSATPGARSYQVRAVDDGEEFYRITTTRTSDSDWFAAGKPQGEHWGRLCYYVKALAPNQQASPESEACFDVDEPEWLPTPSVDATVDGDTLTLRYTPTPNHAHALTAYVNGRSLGRSTTRGSNIDPEWEVPLDGATGQVCGVLQVWRTPPGLGTADKLTSRLAFNCVETGAVPTIAWSPSLECAADGTRTMSALISVSEGQRLGTYRVFRSRPGNDDSVQHGKFDGSLQGDDPSETVATLDGVPPGRWVFEVRTFFGLKLEPIVFEVDGCGSSASGVTWGALSACHPTYRSRTMTASVTNNTDADADYRIVMIDADSGVTVHGSHAQMVRSGQTGPVGLGGIPPGNWVLKLLENGDDIGQSITLVSESCNSNTAPVVWGSITDCDADGIRRLKASVTNRSGFTAAYRMLVLDPQSGRQVHASHDHTIRNQETAFVSPGGVPEGRWLFKITENGRDYGPPRTLTVPSCEDPEPACVGDIAETVPVLEDYLDQVGRGNDLDLDLVEATADRFNGNENHVVLQSLVDPVVAEKDIIIDEYFTTVVPGPNLDSKAEREAFLGELAADMDGVLGGEFAQLADFKNQGTTPEVGQVIDIDVDATRYGDIAFVNAPVVITHIEPTCFGAKTIEYNGDEHILHGDRRWGYELLANGNVRFYTRALSIPDRFYGQTQSGEREFWGLWLDGVERYVVDGGGQVAQGRRNYQVRGHSGPPLWLRLTTAMRDEIQAAQIDGHRREADRLTVELEEAIANNASVQIQQFLRAERDQHVEEATGWENR